MLSGLAIGSLLLYTRGNDMFKALTALWSWLKNKFALKSGDAGLLVFLTNITWVNSSGDQEKTFFEGYAVGVLNCAANNVCVLEGPYSPSGGVWSILVQIGMADFGVTLNNGRWSCSVPVGTFSEESIATVSITASRNGIPAVGLEPYSITFGQQGVPSA